MACPKKLEGRAQTQRAAFRLFVEKGYTATTYADIASAVGKERTSVQGFYPKKELLALKFSNDIVLGNEEFASAENLLEGNALSDLYAIGQLNIGFLVKDKNMRRLARDVLSDRSITVKSLMYNEEWVERFMQASLPGRGELEESFMIAQGGGYELLYKLLVDDKAVDAYALVCRIIDAFAALAGLPPATPPAPLNPDTIKRSNDFLMQRLLA